MLDPAATNQDKSVFTERLSEVLILGTGRVIMIVRILEAAAASRPDVSIEHPAGAFGRIDVLQLTSRELQDMYKIELRDLDVQTPFELAAALEGSKGAPTAARVRKDRLVRLVLQRNLLPCFVGYQEVRMQGLLPFMTDGPHGRWSLFFAANGEVVLVERAGEQLHVLIVDPAEVRSTGIGRVQNLVADSMKSARRLLPWGG